MKPQFVWFTWIAEHGDSIAKSLEAAGLKGLEINIPVRKRMSRPQVSAWAKKDSTSFSKFIGEALGDLATDRPPVLVTLDWHPVFRLIVEKARQMGFPTVLVPHENIFFREDDYYRDPASGHNIPITDFAYLWGPLQADIFVGRGYPPDSIKITGTPKFDTPMFTNSTSQVNSARKFLFAAQPLDNVTVREDAIRAQKDFVAKICEFSLGDPQMDFMLRTPPGQHKFDTAEKIRSITGIQKKIDSAPYRHTSQNALAWADITFSLGSTMMLESVLAGKKACVCATPEISPIWKQIDLPVVRKNSSMNELLKLIEEMDFSEIRATAIEMFSPGQLDGLSSKRIAKAITNLY